MIAPTAFAEYFCPKDNIHFSIQIATTKYNLTLFVALLLPGNITSQKKNRPSNKEI